MIPASRRALCVPILALSAAIASCGKKGPPLPPLHLVPAAPTDIAPRRVGDTMLIRFTLPSTNANGPGPVDLDRVEIYAVTAAPGTLVPPNRDLLTKKYLVGSIAVRPAPVEGEPAPEPGAGKDARPLPGEAVTFIEQLTAEKLKPAPLPVEPPAAVGAAAPGAAAPGAATPGAAAPGAVPDTVARRIYAIRGMSRRGRPGQAAERISLPLTPPPAPVSALAAAFTEKAVTLKWTPPAAATGAPAPAAETTPPAAPPTLVFNVYKGADVANPTAAPLNAAPLAEPSFEQPVSEAGVEHCFAVRTAERRGAVLVESEPSGPHCLTPRDIFAPAAPTGFNGVPNPGAIDLRWDPNTEPDLAGYVVLRGEAPGDTLQALTAEPIREARYSDTTAKPGVRYVYAVVAVDKAKPPNTSAQSARVEIAAR